MALYSVVVVQRDNPTENWGPGDKLAFITDWLGDEDSLARHLDNFFRATTMKIGKIDVSLNASLLCGTNQCDIRLASKGEQCEQKVR